MTQGVDFGATADNRPLCDTAVILGPFRRIRYINAPLYFTLWDVKGSNVFMSWYEIWVGFNNFETSLLIETFVIQDVEKKCQIHLGSEKV